MSNISMSKLVVVCMVLVLITLSVYWQTGNDEFLNFDDKDYITENHHVLEGITGPNIIWAFTSFYASNWHPVTWLSHQLDAQLFGLNPRGHHLASVVIHAVSSVLLLLLLVRSTGLFWQSTFVAALFALHPLHVESVAWAAERKDVLSAFFGFLTLIFYAEYVTKRKTMSYLLAFVFFLLGLMTKPMLITIPMVMLLLDYWPLNRYRHEGLDCRIRQLSGLVFEHLKEKIPFFACSLFSAIITICAQYQGGSVQSLGAFPLTLRVENALLAYINYMCKTFWPTDLAIFYPLPLSIPISTAMISLVFLSLLSVAALCAGSRYPYLPVGWFWFLITLVPVIGILQVGGQAMADRYTYLPVIGIFIMVSWGVADLAKYLELKAVVPALFGGAILVVSSVLTWHQLGYWHDSFTIARHALQVTTGNSVALNNLGEALAGKGEFVTAIKEYRKAIAINPLYLDAHNNLGNALANSGNFDEAIKEYKAVLAMDSNYSEAHNNLGNALASKGDLDAAIREYRNALAITPDYPDARYNLEIALKEQQKPIMPVKPRQ